MNEQTLFFRAVEISDPSERAAFLDRECGNDSALRERLARLIERHAELGNFLEQPAPLAGTTAAFVGGGNQGTSLAPGDSLGPYRLVKMLGEGGMGTVWLAEQSDPVRRRVAVKVVREGMDSRTVLARFEAERQALAIMDHPCIARVF